MSTVKQSVEFRQGGGNLHEAVAIALGRKGITTEANLQEGEQAHSQSQKWLVPDEDKANRAMLNVKKYLPDAKHSISAHDGVQGGYVLTVTGTYKDSDVAACVSNMGGVTRLDAATVHGVH